MMACASGGCASTNSTSAKSAPRDGSEKLAVQGWAVSGKRGSTGCTRGSLSMKGWIPNQRPSIIAAKAGTGHCTKVLDYLKNTREVLGLGYSLHPSLFQMQKGILQVVTNRLLIFFYWTISITRSLGRVFGGTCV